MAGGLSGVAGLLAVVEEEDVEGVALLRAQGFLEDVLRAGGLGAWGHPAGAEGDSVDVSVDGEEGHAACEHEDAGGGFGPDAGEVGEVVHGVLRGEAAEEAKGDASVVGADALEDVPDAGGFLTGEAGHADGPFDV